MKHISARGAVEDQNKKVMLMQQLLPVVSKDFMVELVRTFLAADIPLHKLCNLHVIELFKNLGQKVPSETVCRDYVKTLANNIQDFEVPTERQVDESEVDKTKIINVTVGDIDVPEKTYLIECCYMVACTVTLKVLYLRLFHVACLAHMLHYCAEKVCGAFVDGDNLVACVKAATIKNKSRQTQFKHISSSLEWVVTRWGTWLKAVDYYADNLIEVKIVNEGNGILVKRAKEAVSDTGITASLLKIKWDYSQLPKIIQKVESPKFSIAEAHTAIFGKFYSVY